MPVLGRDLLDTEHPSPFGAQPIDLDPLEMRQRLMHRNGLARQQMAPDRLPQRRTDVDRIEGVPLGTHRHEPEAARRCQCNQSGFDRGGRFRHFAERQAAGRKKDASEYGELRRRQLRDAAVRQTRYYDVLRVTFELIDHRTDPIQDLRGAVLARLDRRSRWRWAWLALPATVAAIVVLTVAIRDRGASVHPTPTNPAVAQIVSTPAPSPAAVTEPARRRAASRRPAQTMASIRSLAALPGPRALQPVDIQPDALAIPLLHMKPIATEPIAIRTIEDGSDRRE